MQRTISGILIGLIVAASTGTGDVAAGETMTPLERLASTPKGQLKNPYAVSIPKTKSDSIDGEVRPGRRLGDEFPDRVLTQGTTALARLDQLERRRGMGYRERSPQLPQ